MPELTLKEQAIAAEYKYWKERQAQLEARTDTLSTPDDRHQGRQYQADWADAFHFHGREPPMQREGESSVHLQSSSGLDDAGILD